MKYLFAILVCLSPVLSHADATDANNRGPTPIQEAVVLASEPFAVLVLENLSSNTLKRTTVRLANGGHHTIYSLASGLSCTQSVAPLTPGNPARRHTSCSIMPEGGWRRLGPNTYGSGSSEEFSVALFRALKVKAVRESGISIKTLELNRPDGDGGTERNQLSCAMPNASAVRMGFRPSCSLIDAL